MVTLHAKCTIMLIILFVTADTGSCQHDLGSNRGIVAVDTLKILVFPIQFEAGFIVIEIPIFPVSGVVASFTSGAKRAFMHILLLMTRPAVRFRFFEDHSQMAFLALYQRVFSRQLEA